MSTTDKGINTEQKIAEILVTSSMEKLEILPAVFKVANIDNPLAQTELEGHLSVEILKELGAGSQHPVRKSPVTAAEDLEAEKFSAYAKAFFGTGKRSKQDTERLIESLELNPDDFLKGGGNGYKGLVRKAMKAVEVALQQTTATNSALSIPSLYEMSKQGTFAGIDGAKFPAFQPQYSEIVGNKVTLSTIKENGVFPLGLVKLNLLIRAINKCNTKATVIFAGTNLFNTMIEWKENNKHLFEKSSFDFSDNKYMGLELIECSYGDWGSIKEFTNRCMIFGLDSLQIRTNEDHLTPVEGDGIKNDGESRIMKIITIIYYFLIAPHNRAGCGQGYFPDLEIK